MGYSFYNCEVSGNFILYYEKYWSGCNYELNSADRVDIFISSINTKKNNKYLKKCCLKGKKLSSKKRTNNINLIHLLI